MSVNKKVSIGREVRKPIFTKPFLLLFVLVERKNPKLVPRDSIILLYKKPLVEILILT